MSNKNKKLVKPAAKPVEKEADLKLSSNSRYLPTIITGIFFLLSLIGILNHEMWRDEYQAWMVARDAHSFSQLLQNLRYEGNPVLWHFFLFLMTSLTHNAFWMQVFHILISTSFVFLFNRYSPFNLIQKFLFTFGYYSFFEYNLISRSYGLGLLLVVIFCILYKERKKHYLLIALILFLLANTHVFGLMLSFAFTGILLLDYVLSAKSKKAKKITLILFGCLFIIFSGWILSILQIYPKPDSTFPVFYPTEGEDKSLRFHYAFYRLVTSYFPLPKIFNLHFWNTNILEPVTSTNDGDVVDGLKMNPVWPALVFVIFFLSLIRKPLMLLLYAGGTGGLFCFYYYTELFHGRYCGHLFVLLLSVLWISFYYKEKHFKNKFLLQLSTWAQKAGMILFYIVLVVGFIGGTGSYYKDMMLPFSASAEAAHYLKEQKFDKMEIVGSTDFIISPLAAILDRTIFYAQMNRQGSFIIWNKERHDKLNISDVIEQMENKADKGINKMLFITEIQLHYVDSANAVHPLMERMISNDLHIQFLKEVESGIVTDEKYYLYMVEKEKMN